jgi:cytochrome P450
MSIPKLPPGPPPVTNLLSKIKLFMQLNRSMIDVFSKWHKTYGDLVCIQVDNKYQYFVTHPDHIYQVLVTEAASFYKDQEYKHPQRGMARFLGNGLVISDGEFWKRQRRLVAPALHTQRIANYAQAMVDFAAEMIDHWRDGAQVDVSKEMVAVTLKIVARTLFNVDVAAEVERMGEAMDVMQRVAGQPQIFPPWVPTPQEIQGRQAKRDLDDFIYRIIDKRRLSGEDKGDLLSMLLLTQDEDGSTMTRQQARDEAVTLFLAGHETTANALNWTWYLLAKNPDMEARLHQELDSVLGGRLPTLADLEHLPYTEMVIKESLRLYPPAWGFSRETIADVDIGGYPIRKGSVVGVMPFLTHRDPRWWSQPEKFMPERFSPENEGSIHRYAYIPFGGGPRICIGNAFAMMETRLILATVASRYRLALQPGQTVEMLPLITLNPKGGLPMTLRARVPEGEKVAI